ncbi:MAG: YaaA family protein [Campylobacterales bacterium]|nr:YaaA family protein [Campylobacterales bacterium]
MKILLAPSETKIHGGSGSFIIDNLLFPELNTTRLKLLESYQTVIDQKEQQQLTNLFGLKKEKDIEPYLTTLLLEPVMKAIERYTGVAFDYLDYPSLNREAQHYIDTHVLLCSNLFGFVRADDMIPDYRVKQGAMIGALKPEVCYTSESHLMEAYLADDEILDLRAAFYEKFYKPVKPYTTLKFIKEGKVVSHWAKAYRGIVLREIAKAGVETVEDFMNLPIEGLTIDEIQTKKNKTEIIYTITI